MKIAWKTINGYGPYAYLQHSMRNAQGVPTSAHVQYLGADLEPGQFVEIGPVDKLGWPGGTLKVPDLPEPEAHGQGPAGTATAEPLPATKAAPKPTASKKAAATKKAPSPKPLAAQGKTHLGATASPKAPPAQPKTAPAKAVVPKHTPTTKPQAKAPGYPAQSQPAPAPAPASSTSPKLAAIPKDAQGKPLIAPSNVKKLETAAAGGVAALEKLAATLAEKKLGPAKQAAVANAVADLKGQLLGQPTQEGASESGLAETIEAVKDGDLKLPERAVPSIKVVQQQQELLAENQKDWNADLEQISGKKGSNEGGLFKDKQLNTFHYVKWSGSEARARVEALVGALYTLAETPVPTLAPIQFKDQTAVMSDWIDNTAPMTVAAMKQHPEVRRNFAVDAWLANWDVVGLQADNIVQGEGDKAYRIDLGGSLIFRAQGKGKPLPAEVPELESMLNPGVNPQAAQVFADLTAAELRAGAEKVGAISDQQIDEAVDRLGIPKTSPEYPAAGFGTDANDLPAFLKERLKQRRDYIVEEVLKAEVKKKAALTTLKKTATLKPASLELLAEKAGSLKLNSPAYQKRALQDRLLGEELGPAQGEQASQNVYDTYKGWKGWADTRAGRFLRWAAGELSDNGDLELRRIQRFCDFQVKEGIRSKATCLKDQAEVEADSASNSAPSLVAGLKVTNQANHAILTLQHPGQQEITIYRRWPADQAKYLGLDKEEIGGNIELDDPPLYSWSFDDFAKTAGHGQVGTKMRVPLKNIVLTDRINNPDKYNSENEVLFKGLQKAKLEVVKKG